MSETAKRKISLEDFVAYMPQHNYIFVPTREPWPAASVDSQLPPVPLIDNKGKPKLDKKGKEIWQPAHAWLDRNRPVHQMTWWPGAAMVIHDHLVGVNGWFEKQGMNCFNLYRLPLLRGDGDARKSKPWLDHAYRIYPDDADHIIKWLAQRVQRPADKINHALLLGGAQGIGKDTLLVPVMYAVGPWNFEEVSPRQMFGRFKGYLKSVILRISEAHDLGDQNRFTFYELTKGYCAAPPETLSVDEKNLREYRVLNCCGVIITTNYKTDGIHLPPDDRRHYVAWSDCHKEDFSPAYWNQLYAWYAKGGIEHVAAYLTKLDISKFDAKAPPPLTPAFWAIVDANRAPEEAELADAFDKLGNPAAVTLAEVIHVADLSLSQWLEDRKNRRIIPHRFEKCGYVPVRNPTNELGLWRVNGVRQVIYAKNNLSLKEQLAAAEALRRRADQAAKAAVANLAAAREKRGKPLKAVRFTD